MNNVLLVDIGNSNIVIGVHNGGNLISTHRILTKKDYSYEELLSSFRDNLSEGPFSGAILTSVVPEIADVTLKVLKTLTGRDPLLAGLSLDTGIDTSDYDTSCLGTDRIVDLVAASSICGTPTMVCDLGTCTTISVINYEKKLIGGMICAGVQLSLDAQAQRASQLPQLTASENFNLLGTDTASNMISGAVSGTGILISAVAEKISSQYNLPDLKVVVTGGLGRFVIPWIDRKVVYEPDLLMKGLYELYRLNT
jgi:type III pantothenate kinase